MQGEGLRHWPRDTGAGHAAGVERPSTGGSAGAEDSDTGDGEVRVHVFTPDTDSDWCRPLLHCQNQEEDDVIVLLLET